MTVIVAWSTSIWVREWFQAGIANQRSFASVDGGPSGFVHRWRENAMRSGREREALGSLGDWWSQKPILLLIQSTRYHHEQKLGSNVCYSCFSNALFPRAASTVRAIGIAAIAWPGARSGAQLTRDLASISGAGRLAAGADAA
jgi:hypothetical protein